MIKISFLLLIVIIVGCSSSEKRAPYKKYKVNFAEKGWRDLGASEKADFSFQSKRLESVLYASSFCDSKNTSEYLSEMSERLYSGIRNLEYRKKDWDTLFEREAYYIDAAGLVDGKKVWMRSMSVYLKSCNIDFVLISNAPISKEHQATWGLFLESIRINE